MSALADVPEMAGVRFDMIGNLQKNKINQVIGRAHLIHSISSTHLAQGVSTRSLAAACAPDVLLEVNVSGRRPSRALRPRSSGRTSMPSCRFPASGCAAS